MSKLSFLVLVAVAYVQAKKIDDQINWSKVRPISYYPEFWQNRENQPPPEYFEQTNYESVKGYIASGNIAGRNDFPFKTALISQMPFGDSLCGASLVSRWAVLTAASCVHGAASTIIILGASDVSNPDEPRQVRFRVLSTNFRIHPMYRPGVTTNDVAVVRFNFAIHTFTREISPVRLPHGSMLTNLFENVPSYVTGFGRNSPFSENSYRLLFINTVTLRNRQGQNSCSPRLRVEDSHICTEAQNGGGLCNGDIGAPLVINDMGAAVQIGIGAFFPGSGCTSTVPLVFTRVTGFVGFIEQNIH